MRSSVLVFDQMPLLNVYKSDNGKTAAEMNSAKWACATILCFTHKPRHKTLDFVSVQENQLCVEYKVYIYIFKKQQQKNNDERNETKNKQIRGYSGGEPPVRKLPVE